MPEGAPSSRELSGMIRKHKAFARKHGPMIHALLAKYQLRPNSQPKNWHALFLPLTDLSPNGKAQMALNKFLASGYKPEQWMSFQRDNRDLFVIIEGAEEILDVGDKIRMRLFKLRLFEEEAYAGGLEYLEANEYTIITPFLYALEERLASFLSISKEELDTVFRD